jgi:TonB family protein
MNDEFLYGLRVRPQPRFASELKMKLDQPSNEWEHSMSAYLHARAPISHRSLALFAIIGLHAAFIFVFANGLMQTMTVGKDIEIDARVLNPEQQPVEAPAPLKPEFKRFPTPVPEPPVPLDFAPEAPTASAAGETLVPAYGAMAVQDTGGSFVRARIGRNFPNPDSFYPPSAIRQEIAGNAVVRVCVGPDGKLAEAPQIVQSTQSHLLDDAALRLARAGSYVAGSRGGMAVTDCFKFKTTFQIKNKR